VVLIAFGSGEIELRPVIFTRQAGDGEKLLVPYV